MSQILVRSVCKPRKFNLSSFMMYVKTGDIKIGETFPTYRFNNSIIHNKHLKGPSSEYVNILDGNIEVYISLFNKLAMNIKQVFRSVHSICLHRPRH